MSTVRANKWENPDGTENFKCRAWVNFNGTGTVAIRASGNVSSITDNGTGDYTVNFTTAMSDVNYSVCGTARVSGNHGFLVPQPDSVLTTSAVKVTAVNGSMSAGDALYVFVSVFR